METFSYEQASVYTELNGLEALKLQAKSGSQEGLEQVAQQFESLFYQELMKNMRTANSMFTKDSYLNSNEIEFYQNMLDQQMSISLGEKKSLGIAELLIKQLQHSVE